MPSPRWAYLCLLVWIPGWLALAPAGLTYTSISLAFVSLIPLLFPLAGILKNKPRAQIWGAYVSLPAFLIGVMEGWSNPVQRAGALVQLALVVVYWALVILRARDQHHRE